MTREELAHQSEAYIRELLKARLPAKSQVFLYGSRARHDNRWNSDYDLWIDEDIPRRILVEMLDQLDESFVPFKVDIVTTQQLTGRFAEAVRKKARLWM